MVRAQAARRRRNTGHPGASRWFKIRDFVGCISPHLLPSFGGVDPPVSNWAAITLPAWLPSASHAVLRFEWLAVQQAAHIEFFVSCADVVIEGTAECAPLPGEGV